jgi:hypothetical protein
MDSTDDKNKIEQVTEDLIKLESENTPSVDEIDHFSRNQEARVRYKKLLGERFYSTVIFVLTHKNYTEDKAKANLVCYCQA